MTFAAVTQLRPVLHVRICQIFTSRNKIPAFCLMSSLQFLGLVFICLVVTGGFKAKYIYIYLNLSF